MIVHPFERNEGFLIGQLAFERDQVRILAYFDRMAGKQDDDSILGPAGAEEVCQSSLDHRLRCRMGADLGRIAQLIALVGRDVQCGREAIKNLVVIPRLRAIADRIGVQIIADANKQCPAWKRRLIRRQV